MIVDVGEEDGELLEFHRELYLPALAAQREPSSTR